MKKYILYNCKEADPAYNRVYEWSDNRIDGKRHDLKVLDDFKTLMGTTIKKDSLVTLSLKYSKDVTEILDKIEKLKDVLHKSRTVWSRLSTIERNFKNGIYPSENDFELMNENWNNWR